MDIYEPKFYNTWKDLKFEFPKYTEITDLAFAVNPQYKREKYSRFFVCDDVKTIWFIRVIPGMNEEYEEDSSKILVERVNIEKRNRIQLSVNKLIKIIEDDNGDNYDCRDYNNIEDVIESLSDIYGINNLKQVE